MNDRGLAETLVTLPARRLRQGEVNLHVAAAEAETLGGLGDPGRNIDRIEQPPVELRRCDVADDCTLRTDGVAAYEPYSGRTTRLDENSLNVPAGLANAAVISNQAHERIDEPRAAAAGNRHAAGFDRERDHAGHESRRGGIGPESCVEDPRREEPVRTLRAKCRRQPVPAAQDDLGAELGETSASETAVRLGAEAQSGARPQLGAEHAEDELRLRTDGRDRLSPGLAVACGMTLELRGICVGVRGEERARAVREQRAGRVLGVQVLEPALGKGGTELCMCRAADPERMPRAEHVVMEARLGELGCPHSAAQLSFAFEDGHAPAATCQERRAGKRVDAAADEDSVVVSHARAAGIHRR